MRPTDFAKALSHYLGVHLPGQRSVSPNTIKSYRDTFKLFLVYCRDTQKVPVERLSLGHINALLVVEFLTWLESERRNSISTRNQRLACIHGFYRYMQTQAPVSLLEHQKILAIPMKKAPQPAVTYLIPDALKLILAQPDLNTRRGRRDLTLLSVLYDTGARVQELVDLTVRHVRLDHPPILTLTGKGRKTRQVPLMSNTENLLKRYMAESRLLQNGKQDNPLFFNRQFSKLTSEGVTFILSKHASNARAVSSIVPDKVTPHVLRHTKAMHLLQAGVSLVYIRDLLGHVDISTTDIYARTDTELKRKALEKAYPDMISEGLPPWAEDEDLLGWLSSIQLRNGIIPSK